MAFDWRDVFLLAHQLRNETEESKRRTAIGRAYYYAYNAANIEAKKLGFNDKDPSFRGMGLHQKLWTWCQNHRDPIIVLLGDSANTLKSRRTDVDYKLSKSPSPQDVQKQLDETRDFEITLAQLTNNPPPPPLP